MFVGLAQGKPGSSDQILYSSDGRLMANEQIDGKLDFF